MSIPNHLPSPSLFSFSFYILLPLHFSSFTCFFLKSLFAFLSPSFFLLILYFSFSLPLPSGLYTQPPPPPPPLPYSPSPLYSAASSLSLVFFLNLYSPFFLLFSFFSYSLYCISLFFAPACPVGCIPEPRPLPSPSSPFSFHIMLPLHFFLFHLLFLKSLFAFLSPSFFLHLLYFCVLCPCPVGCIPNPPPPPHSLFSFSFYILLPLPFFIFHLLFLKSLFAFLSFSNLFSLALPSGLYNGVRCVLFLVLSGWLYFLHAGLVLLPCCLLTLSPPLHPCIQQGLVSVLPVLSHGLSRWRLLVCESCRYC